jgi:glutamate-1-semialdehyde 2,1-aminomutase
MRPILGVSMIEILLNRLDKANRIHRIMLATLADGRNAPLVADVEKLDHGLFRGSENEVFNSYCHAALAVGADVVIRMAGDCPLIDPDVVHSRLEGVLSVPRDGR